MNKKRLIIAGGRDFDDFPKLLTNVVSYCVENKIRPSDLEVVSGTANGADKLGEEFANRAECNLTRMPAQWKAYGKSAGYRRNYDMAVYAHEFKDGACICFWDGKSRGTKMMIEIAKKMGLDTIVVNY